MSFPIAVHAEAQQPQRVWEPSIIDVTVEVGSVVVDFAAKVAKRWNQRQRRKPSSPSSRISLASSSTTDETMLTKLSIDSDSMVRSEVIFNPSTPVRLLVLLTTDPDHFVAAQAKARLAAIAS